MGTKGFNRHKMIWLNTISKDSRISAVAFRIAYRIADHCNEQKRIAWPSQIKLANDIGVSVKTAQRALSELVRNIYMETIRRAGTSNAYRPLLERTARSIKSHHRRGTGGLSIGQRCPNTTVNDVSLNYSENLNRNLQRKPIQNRNISKDFDSLPSGEPDDGKFELVVMRALGEDGVILMGRLSEDARSNLIRAAREGRLTPEALEVARAEASEA